MNHLSVADIAGLFPGKSGLPLNRAVKPAIQISDEALKAVEGMAPVNASAGLDLSSRFPRTSVMGAQLAQQFPGQVEGDRAQARAQKKMFRDITSI